MYRPSRGGAEATENGLVPRSKHRSARSLPFVSAVMNRRRQDGQRGRLACRGGDTRPRTATHWARGPPGGWAEVRRRTEHFESGTTCPKPTPIDGDKDEDQNRGYESNRAVADRGCNPRGCPTGGRDTREGASRRLCQGSTQLCGRARTGSGRGGGAARGAGATDPARR